MSCQASCVGLRGKFETKISRNIIPNMSYQQATAALTSGSKTPRHQSSTSAPIIITSATIDLGLCLHFPYFQRFQSLRKTGRTNHSTNAALSSLRIIARDPRTLHNHHQPFRHHDRPHLRNQDCRNREYLPSHASAACDRETSSCRTMRTR